MSLQKWPSKNVPSKRSFQKCPIKNGSPKMSLSHFDSPFTRDIHHMTSVIDIDTTNAILPSSVIRRKKSELIYLFICVSVIRHSSIAQTEAIQRFFSFYPSSVIRHYNCFGRSETALLMTKICHPSSVICHPF